ncbi:hypothetical protein [Ancylobacter sp. IITR112]|uniref:hypothetical protein n=1 Tax=Ancylobacter sp. IITR112 TaxID=3138073 RepID=UPI00352B3259
MAIFLAAMIERPAAASSTAYALRFFLVGALLLALQAAAEAHQPRTNTENDLPRGLEIPAITHSDMAFVSAYFGSIIALADRQTRTDDRFRRLLNYTKIQRMYCLWGLIPRAIENEASSFNLCSHAYLAGAWALLQDLATKAMAREEANEIVAAVERDRAMSPTFVLCESSVEIFHTGEFIVPLRPVAVAGWLFCFAVAGGLTAAFGRAAVTKASSRMRP